DGGLLGLTSATPNYISDLLKLVKEGNMKEAMDLEDKFYGLVSEIYKDPKTDIPARLKFILYKLGIIETAKVRDPFNQISLEDEQIISKEIETLDKKEL